MDNALAAAADGSMRELARLALSDDWSREAAVAALAGNDPSAVVAAYEEGLRPLAEVEPTLKGAKANELRTWLKPIGMKIAPTMSEDICAKWLGSEVLALSDLPPKIAVQAARKAIHTPMQYLNQVDGYVRAEADKIIARHREALARLRRLQESLARAAMPQPQLTDQFTAERFTAAEIRAMSPAMRAMGLGCGGLTQEEIDAAFAETGTEEDRAAA